MLLYFINIYIYIVYLYVHYYSAQADKSRDSYIVPITLEDSAVNVPHYEDLDHEPTKKMSVHELPDISQGIPPPSTTSLSLPQRMDEKYHPGTATASPQFTDRLYSMGIGQSGTMPPPLAQQQSKPGTEQKKKIKNPFKYFLQKRDKSQSSSKAKPVTTRSMASYQIGRKVKIRMLMSHSTVIVMLNFLSSCGIVQQACPTLKFHYINRPNVTKCSAPKAYEVINSLVLRKFGILSLTVTFLWVRLPQASLQYDLS